MQSSGFRFFAVGLLALFMFVPLFFSGQIVEQRARYSEATTNQIGRDWGGQQVL